jgi:hypothetical protein
MTSAMNIGNDNITSYETYAVYYSDQLLGFTNADDSRIDGLFTDPSEKALTEVRLVGPVESVDTFGGLLAAPQIKFSITPTKMRLRDFLSRRHDERVSAEGCLKTSLR